MKELLKDGECHALAVQQSNFFGFLEPLKEISHRAKKHEVPLVVVADSIVLSALKPPGFFGADIVVREGQQMSAFLNFGGPYVGFFAARMEYVRKMSGRLVGLVEYIEFYFPFFQLEDVNFWYS